MASSAIWRTCFVLSGIRNGLATVAARNGASEASIMRPIGHHRVRMVRRYIREEAA